MTRLWWVSALGFHGIIDLTNVISVRDVEPNIGHDGNKHVLLFSEMARVETDNISQDRKAPIGHELFPSLAQGNCDTQVK